MKGLIISLALIATFLSPVWALAPNQPFIAVFVDKSLANNYSDNVHEFGVFWVAKDFSSFDKFLLETKKKAGARKIILDLSFHGLPMVFICGTDKGLATTGGLINHIEAIIPSEQIECVCFEPCYAGQVYNRSFHAGADLVNPLAKRCLLEARLAPNPKFPVWGLPNSRNVPPNVLEQVIHNQYITIEDLRQYENKFPVVLAPDTEQMAVTLQRMILARLLYTEDGVQRVILLKK